MESIVKIEELKAYEVIEKRWIEDLSVESYLIKHKKTGAKIALLSNDDDNKVFYIGFRTPPTNSTGVAHILEHSVLCGSKNFPLKDPFIELAKGSLNTFLNAMTYPDKTVYPVASCNDVDFQNLCHVYLDAVFYPNIHTEEKIFKQEGWHYELENFEDELTMNGVVYNEMKGAFSSPDDVLDREIFNSLFPTTTYGHESGGHPNHIPELSYEEFLAFHKSYYHPSNSYSYLYGNVDMAEKLQWMDEEYFSKFDELTIESRVVEEKVFSQIVEKVIDYPITDEESEEDNTYLAYNTVVGKSLERELYVAFQVINYVICAAPGAPIKKSLIDKGIGTDVYSSYENGIFQPFFSIIAKNANQNQKQEFASTIKEVLETVVKEGIDKNALKAAINSFEFRYKEADFGAYPKGLMYGLQILDSWIYDENQPFIHIEANNTFAFLKEKIETSYYEDLIVKYLLQNAHQSLVMLVPVKGLTLRSEQEMQASLQTYKESLTEDEISHIISETKALEAYQEEPSRKEDIEKIPLLKRKDMKLEVDPFINEERTIGETKVLFHDVVTNGINYVKLLFNAKQVPVELLPYMGILKTVLGYIDTQEYEYGDLFNEMNMKTGGISLAMNTYTNATNFDDYLFTFEVKTKVLYENTEKAFDLLEEIIFHSKIEDTKRLFEIIKELKSRTQAGMTSAGHSVAAGRAMSYFSERAEIAELTNGLSFYRVLEDIEKNFNEVKDQVVENLKQLMQLIFRPENLMVDITATEDGYSKLPQLISHMRTQLHTTSLEANPFTIQTKGKNEGFWTSSQVQYVCRAGNYLKGDLSYTGALKILKVILGYEYLWNNVRVKGGAYGCMCNFGRTGDAYFVSYRDPNLASTVEVYEKSADFIAAFDADERTITKFIIGAIGEMDTPLNPAAKGSRSLIAYLSNLPIAELQKERNEVLQVTTEEIQRLAQYITAFLADEYLCVVGNEEQIKSNKDLFMKAENLFN